MSIEQNLERIANALEKIADCVANPMRMIPIAPGVATEVPATIQKAAETSAAAPVTLTREQVKAELTKAKIPFNDRMRTESLLELLNKSKAQPVQKEEPAAPAAKPEKKQPEKKAEAPAPATTEDFLNTEPAAPKVYSVEEARDNLKRFAAKFGSEKAIAILTKFGCKDISSVNTAGKLQEFALETLKQEKEREPASGKK